VGARAGSAYRRSGRAGPGRARAKKFIRFLKKIDRAVAKHLAVHAICDNDKTHKTTEVQAWLAKHPRFKLHFIRMSRDGSPVRTRPPTP
jgi:hypothetical protein